MTPHVRKMRLSGIDKLQEENLRLKEEKKDHLEQIHRLLQAHHELTRVVREQLDGDRSIRCPHGRFRFIPMSSINAFNLLQEAKKHCKIPVPHFLDVGCGIGNILQIADVLGYRTWGVEYDKRYVKAAPDVNISNVDAFDYEHYSIYDVIYFWRPIADTTLMYKLHDLITDQMKIGAFLIPLGLELKTRQSGLFKKIAYSIFQKL